MKDCFKIKCVAHIKGCWNPEFEPSVEEIIGHMAIFLVHFFVSSYTMGFPYSI